MQFCCRKPASKRAEARPWSRNAALGLTAVAAAGCPSTDVAPAVSPSPTALALAATMDRPLDPDDPSTCARCHAAVYTEWTESMHAQAHHARDPIYGAMRTFRMELGQKIEGKCAHCHAPRATEDLEGPAARAGVSCATCHNVDGVHPGEEAHGRAQIDFADALVMRSARDLPDGVSPVHGTGPAVPALADGETLCLACHGAHANPAGVPVCTTGSELDAHAGDETCVSCHMPEVEGPSGAVSERPSHRSHAFLGPHRSYQRPGGHILEQAVALELQPTPSGVTVTLSNRSGHGFPSGFPGRFAVLRLVGRDASGEIRWRNFDSNPMAEDPDAVFNKIYADDDGAPTLPPLATALKRDARLRPDETRTLGYELPPEVVRVEADLTYHLLPAPAAARIGLEAPDLVRGVPVARAAVERD
jgi:hypothetical protein